MAAVYAASGHAGLATDVIARPETYVSWIHAVAAIAAAAMSLAAGLSIAQAGLSTGQEAGTILIYVALAGSTILGPLIVYLAMGRRATEILGGWRTWLADNNATVMSVLLLVFAVVLIGQGIAGLSG